MKSPRTPEKKKQPLGATIKKKKHATDTTTKNQTTKSRKTASEKTENRTTERRQYNSSLRQQQSAETRERIITAGAELVHEFPAWDWKNLTFRAGGKRAGISERTVYRYFSTELQLRDAVMQRLVEESGVKLESLELGDFANITTRVLKYVSSFTAATTTVSDPTLISMDQQRREALQNAVIRVTPDWSDPEQKAVAAMLDMLWNLPSYERLITDWRFDSHSAIRAITWLIGLIEEAIRNGRRPTLHE
jgi:AcrR family transcriptional regulator